MKSIINLIIFLATGVVVIAQNAAFVGTWEWEAGNSQVFRVEFTTDNLNGQGNLIGHFTMVQRLNNGSEQVLYTSNRELSPGIGIYYSPSLRGGANSQGEFGGVVSDNTINSTESTFLLGSLKMQIQSTCSTCPVAATWEVKRLPGVILSDDNREFNVPTNIVLTKIE